MGSTRYRCCSGGAALTRSYVERDLRQMYKGRLFYGKDAFEGLRTLDRVMELSRGGEDDPIIRSRDRPVRRTALRRSEQQALEPVTERLARVSRCCH